jgi:hypothetical protein
MVGFARGESSAAAPAYVYFCGDATRCYPSVPGVYQRWGLSIDPLYNKGPLPYLQRFIRHVLFVRGKYFVIFDDLAASQPATWTWLYHIRTGDSPLRFDPKAFTVDYKVDDVSVRLQHIAHPGEIKLDDREGLDARVNPMTGEDLRKGRKGDIPCAHNLWVSNAQKEKTWQFLAIVYPTKPGMTRPEITRLDDATARVGEDVITFNPQSPAAGEAMIVVDPTAMR